MSFHVIWECDLCGQEHKRTFEAFPGKYPINSIDDQSDFVGVAVPATLKSLLKRERVTLCVDCMDCRADIDQKIVDAATEAAQRAWREAQHERKGAVDALADLVEDEG